MQNSRPGDRDETMTNRLRNGLDPAAWRVCACDDLTDQQQSQILVLLERAAAAGVPPAGNSLVPSIPSIAGQPKVFLENQLVLIREGLRDVPAMKAVMGGAGR